ncbi:hypothetical protein D3C73_1155320 [compost metagenome]
MSTAVSLASAQNTGSPSAGISRATAITPMLGARAARVLASPNRINTLINSRRRSKRAKYAVRNGPNAATVNANKVTSSPAWETLTSRSRAIEGNRPTMMNSVVSTVKPAADNSRMGNNMGNSRKRQRQRLPEGSLRRDENRGWRILSECA